MTAYTVDTTNTYTLIDANGYSGNLSYTLIDANGYSGNLSYTLIDANGYGFNLPTFSNGGAGFGNTVVVTGQVWPSPRRIVPT